MAHKKGVGSSKNGRESHSKRLGVKIYGGQAAIAGNIGSQLASATPVQRAPRTQRPATPEITRRPELPRGE